MKKFCVSVTMLLRAGLLFGDHAGAAPVKVENVGELAFVIDCSSSMLTKGGDPAQPRASRWELVQQAYPKWLERLPATVRVGALSVSGFCAPGQQFRFPAGSDRDRISSAVQQASPQGSTPLNAALREAPSLFDKTVPGEKRIVLLSDGENSCPPDVSTCDLIKELRRDHGIALSVVIVGGDQSLWDEARCWAAAGAGEITIGKTLDDLRKIPLPSLDPWPLIVALLTLAGLLLTTQALYRHLYQQGWTSEEAIVNATAFGVLGAAVTYAVLIVGYGFVPGVFSIALLALLLYLCRREPQVLDPGAQ